MRVQQSKLLSQLLYAEYENKGVNKINKSMQTSTNVTENNSNDPALWENIDDDFLLFILKNGLNQKTNIRFTSSKTKYDDGINRYLKKKNISTNQNNKLDSISLI